MNVYNSLLTIAASTPPLMDGTAAVGTEQTYARGDHVHPTDTSRLGVNDTAAKAIALEDPVNTNYKVRIRYAGEDMSPTTHLPMFKNLGENNIQLAPVHKSDFASSIMSDLFEHGSNSNGHYVKFADGLMICWHTMEVTTNVTTAWGSWYESSSGVQWTYPQAFTSNPGLSVSRYRGVAATIEFANNGDYTHTPSIYLTRPNTASGTSVLSFVAIGLWK